VALLGRLQAAGADEQAAALLARDPAAPAALDGIAGRQLRGHVLDHSPQMPIRRISFSGCDNGGDRFGTAGVPRRSQGASHLEGAAGGTEPVSRIRARPEPCPALGQQRAAQIIKAQPVDLGREQCLPLGDISAAVQAQPEDSEPSARVSPRTRRRCGPSCRRPWPRTRRTGPPRTRSWTG
jgi:hypothetical protein